MLKVQELAAYSTENLAKAGSAGVDTSASISADSSQHALAEVQ